MACLEKDKNGFGFISNSLSLSSCVIIYYCFYNRTCHYVSRKTIQDTSSTNTSLSYEHYSDYYEADTVALELAQISDNKQEAWAADLEATSSRRIFLELTSIKVEVNLPAHRHQLELRGGRYLGSSRN